VLKNRWLLAFDALTFHQPPSALDHISGLIGHLQAFLVQVATFFIQIASGFAQRFGALPRVSRPDCGAYNSATVAPMAAPATNHTKLPFVSIPPF
jgi:hypothetical protein